jgi:hypothetical protein
MAGIRSRGGRARTRQRRRDHPNKTPDLEQLVDTVRRLHHSGAPPEVAPLSHARIRGRRSRNLTLMSVGLHDTGSDAHPAPGLPWPPRCARLRGVGCLLALLALISPRLVLFLLWIFSNVLSRAFDSWIIPLLGFLLLPWTTLTYVAFWDWGSGRQVTGFEWFFVVLAFLIDLGSYAQGRRVQYARAEG